MPCNEDSGSVWELMPTWCRVCCSLWLSLQSCKPPCALRLQDPAGIFAPFSCPPSALFLTLYFTLPCPPPSQCSESSRLHHGGHDEENLFTSDCSAHAAAGVWERAETRLPGSHPASRLYPGTSAPQQPSPRGERFFPGSYSLVGRKAFNLELQLIICRVGQFRLC